jgi:hypothetical protein
MNPWLLGLVGAAVIGYILAHIAEQNGSSPSVPPDTTLSLQWQDEPLQQLPLKVPQIYGSQPNTLGQAPSEGQVGTQQHVLVATQPTDTSQYAAPQVTPFSTTYSSQAVAANAPSETSGTNAGGINLSGASISIGSGVGDTAITVPTSAVTGH